MCRLIVFVLAGACALRAGSMRLTLADAQRMAVQNNPRVAAARFAASAAHEVTPQYRAAYQPTFSGNVTGVEADNGSRLAAGGLNNPVVYQRFAAGVSMQQLVTDFGRTGDLVRMARLRAEAQDQATEATKADIVLAASRAYFALLRAQAVLRVADRTVAARQVVADQISALAQSKLKSQLDVSFANVNLADAKLLRVQAANQLEASRAELATVLGLPAPADFDLADTAASDGLPDRVDALLDQAITNRPELKDLRLARDAQQSLSKAERKLSFPTVAVAGAAGFVPASVAAVPDRYGAVGVNVNVPVFNGGLFRARRAEAEMKVRAAEQTLKDAQARILRDVRVAYLDAATARDRVTLTAQLLDQAKLALDLSQSRYELGLGSIVELSQAQLGLTTAQIAEANARYDYQLRRVVVDYQTGALR